MTDGSRGPCYLPPEALAWSASKPNAAARLRGEVEDFQVVEDLGYPLAGAGQHVCLQIRKRCINTADVAAGLARAVASGSAGVGFGGLKDRNAVTTQWFSVDLAGRDEPDWAAALPSGCEVIARVRHGRKLRRGAFACNRFELVLRDFSGDPSEVANRLERTERLGVPNYFGPQRFGRDGANVTGAFEMLCRGRRIRSRHRRGIFLSTARALLFNRVLSRRVEEGTWARPVPGDVMMLDRRHSIFGPVEPDDTLRLRSERQEIHPTGPLWGAGESPAGPAVAELEAQTLAPCREWCDALERVGLKQERRALRVCVLELDWQFEGRDRLRIAFGLPPGSYATTVLRELVNV